MVSMGGGEYGREHFEFVEDLVGDIPPDCVWPEALWSSLIVRHLSSLGMAQNASLTLTLVG